MFSGESCPQSNHDNVITWTSFPRYSPVDSPVDSLHKGTVMQSFEGLFVFADKQMVQLPVIWFIFTLMWRHTNDKVSSSASVNEPFLNSKSLL